VSLRRVKSGDIASSTMNKPSRTDEPQKGDGYNQSPNALSNDLTTHADLNGISNSRELRGNEPSSVRNGDQNGDAVDTNEIQDPGIGLQPRSGGAGAATGSRGIDQLQLGKGRVGLGAISQRSMSGSLGAGDGGRAATTGPRSVLHRIVKGFRTFGSFIGPGFMVAVAYSKCPLRPTIYLPRY
jgi:metal iron transporter